MQFGSLTKAAVVVLCGAIVSEIGLFLLKWLGANCQLMHALVNLANGLDISFTAEQAAVDACIAQLNIVVAAGVAVASFSIVIGGMALGVKAYWKGRALEGAEVLNLANMGEGPDLQNNQPDNQIHQEADLVLQERPAPILRMANVYPIAPHRIDVSAQEEVDNAPPELQNGKVVRLKSG